MLENEGIDELFFLILLEEFDNVWLRMVQEDIPFRFDSDFSNDLADIALQDALKRCPLPPEGLTAQIATRDHMMLQEPVRMAFELWVTEKLT